MNTVREIAQPESVRKAIAAGGLVVIDFSAKWCGPCKRMLPDFEAAAAELSEFATLASVDVDEWPDFAMQFGVQGVPNLTFIKAGAVVDTVIGAIPKEKILERVKRHI